MYLAVGSFLQNGKYRIDSTLGQGGFGITYEAEQVALHRRVAIKEFFMKEYCDRDSTTSHVTLGTSEGSKELVERFRSKFIREAQMIAGFDNPHIIKIYDIFEENGTAYYVMAFLDGGSLADKVKKKGPLSEERACNYIRQIGQALDYIHKRNVLHLDVKPSNILLNSSGEAVLIDFGISKHYDAEGGQTSTAPVGISKGYAPMEQYQQGSVSKFTPATDLYSLGATLYFLLSAETPPDASEVNEDGLPEFSTSISSSTRAAIEKAMSPRRKDRPQSVAEFISLLKRTEYVEVDSKRKESDSQVEISKEVSDPQEESTVLIPNVGENKNSIHGRNAFSNSNNRVQDKHRKLSDTTKNDVIRDIHKKGDYKWIPIALSAVIIAAAIVLAATMNTSNSSMALSADEATICVGETLQLSASKYGDKLQWWSEDFAIASVTSTGLVIGEKEGTTRIEAKGTNGVLYCTIRVIGKIYSESQNKTGKNVLHYKEVNGHYWVDLGLSVKWATCNIGAQTEAELGYYFSWGDSSTKSLYSSRSYQEPVNNKLDVANIYWGDNWRMPTQNEIDELINKCRWTWTNIKGVEGYRVVGPSGAEIFLPAAGSMYDSSLLDKNSCGRYWTHEEASVNSGSCLLFNKNDKAKGTHSKFCGLSARAVYD